MEFPFTSLFANRLVDIMTNTLPVEHLINTFDHIVADSHLFLMFVNVRSMTAFRHCLLSGAR